jgi:hypothetical protein
MGLKPRDSLGDPLTQMMRSAKTVAYRHFSFPMPIMPPFSTPLLCFAIASVNVILLGPIPSFERKGKCLMQLPIVAPAPIVTAHAAIFRDLFENRCQFQHFQHYLTGLIVLDNKSLANITRCVLESADKTNLSRFFSEAPWFQDRVNERRVDYLLQQTQAVRRPKADALLILDGTLCEHVGSLFDYVDRHYNHGEDTYPLAHNPVTSHYVSGPVRFPVDLRLYRRYELRIDTVEL